MKLTRRQFPLAPRFLPSQFLAPFGEFGELDEPTRHLFDDIFGKEFPVKTQGWMPALNVAETKDEFIVTAELPGMKADHVSVDFTDGILTISGEKMEEKTEKEDDRTFYLWERRYGKFQRTLPFPGGIDEKKIMADFKDGVLTVHLLKTEEVKPKRQAIPIVTK